MPAKTTTWLATADTNFTNAANWSNGVAIPGDTIDVASTDYPTTNKPGAGLYFNFQNTTAALDAPDVSNWGDGLTFIGDLTVNAAGAVLNSDIGTIGNVVATLGKVTVSADVGDAETDTVTIHAAGELELGYSALVVHGPVANAGLLSQVVPATLTKAVTLSGSGTIGNGTWALNGGILGTGIVGEGGAVAITGKVNLTSATWNVTASTLVVNAASTLNLGADVPLLDVEIAANVTLGRNLVCHTLTLTSGWLYKNGCSITYDSLVTVAGKIIETPTGILRAESGVGTILICG